jgi:leucine-rich PPR motif-containing protein
MLIIILHLLQCCICFSGVKLTVEHYNALLSCYVENGHAISAMKFIADMHNIEPNEATYHLLLTCVCEGGDIEQATEIISMMKDKGLAASESVFTALVLGHARAG